MPRFGLPKAHLRSSGDASWIGIDHVTHLSEEKERSNGGSRPDQESVSSCWQKLSLATCRYFNLLGRSKIGMPAPSADATRVPRLGKVARQSLACFGFRSGSLLGGLRIGFVDLFLRFVKSAVALLPSGFST